MVVKLSDWAYDKSKSLNKDQWQEILACEHRGMLESLADALKGDTKYFEMSHWFDHEKVFSPLLHRQDSLAGLHANTHIPKIVGLAHRYLLNGNDDDYNMSRFFRKTVVNHHSYTTGGNSFAEHFGKPDQLATQLGGRATFKFQSHWDKMVGQLFGCRIIDKNR